jgi:HlyD family secretion protein
VNTGKQGSDAFKGGNTITALGTVRPAQALQLSFATSGPIEMLPARLGSRVTEGDLLARLDTTALQLQLEDAQAQVTIQSAALRALRNGPSQIEIDRAEAEHAWRVVQAERVLQLAELQLEQAKLSSSDADVTLARTGEAQLELQLAQARAGSPQAEVTVAQVNLAQAQDALEAAQDAYKKALDRPWEAQELRDALLEGVQRAQWDVQIALARLGAAQSAQRVHALGLDLLAAQGGALEAQLDQALNAQAAHKVNLAILAARVDQARQDLDVLNAWVNPLLDPASPEASAQAEARLRQAEVALAKLEWQMRGSELHAPFTGVVSAVHLRTGEWATAGTPVVEVIDTTAWQVETRNVSELSIGRIQVGDEAQVRIIALREQSLQGRVAAISPIAVVQQGDTTYTLFVELEGTQLNLRPGMNAEVEIKAD